MKSHTGERFSRFVVLDQEPTGRDRRLVVARCDCGTVKEVRLDHLKSKRIKSCGCLREEVSRELCSSLSFKHGMTGSPEHFAWLSIVARCTNPRHKNFSSYGGRGVAICDEWFDDFKAFYEYVGPRPSSEHSIDRIDNDGNYEPGNVRWATRKEQQRNKANTEKVPFDGKEVSLLDLCDHFGLNPSTVRGRLRRGWTVEEAFARPIIKTRGEA